MKNLLKVERARNNLSPADLADLVKVSRQTIHAIETYKFIPSALLAFKLARVLKIDINGLFELEEKDW